MNGYLTILRKFQKSAKNYTQDIPPICKIYITIFRKNNQINPISLEKSH